MSRRHAFERWAERLAGDPPPCACGRIHRFAIDVVVDDHALDALIAFLERHRYRSAVVVADPTTAEILGHAVTDRVQRVASAHLVRWAGRPTSDAVTAVEVARRDAAADILIAVGGGVVHDIVRKCAAESGVPFLSVPTCPTVDGFLSTVAALEIDGVKTTTGAVPPLGLFAVPGVVERAPWPLVQAGAGDLLAKVTALTDWQLSAAVTGEPVCPTAYAMAREAVAQVIPVAAGLRAGDPGAVGLLFDSLLLTGLAMMAAGSSRPASGAEHHCSHFWDLLGSRRLLPAALHGTHVGYATRVMLTVYREVRDHWDTHPGAIPAVESAPPRDPRWDDLLPPKAQPHWDAGRVTGLSLAAGVADALAWHELADDALHTLGFPKTPGWLGVGRDVLAATLRYAPRLRDRFTVLDFLTSSGWLDPVIAAVIKEA